MTDLKKQTGAYYLDFPEPTTYESIGRFRDTILISLRCIILSSVYDEYFSNFTMHLQLIQRFSNIQEHQVVWPNG